MLLSALSNALFVYHRCEPEAVDLHDVRGCHLSALYLPEQTLGSHPFDRFIMAYDSP
jgi:hypothetical protein